MTNEKEIKEFEDPTDFLQRSDSLKLQNINNLQTGLKMITKVTEEEKKEDSGNKEKKNKNDPLQTPSFFNNIKGFFL